MGITYSDAQTGEPVEAQRVIITNFDMPFWSMVKLMIKWSIASIPAAIVLFVLGLAVYLGVALIAVAYIRSTYHMPHF